MAHVQTAALVEDLKQYDLSATVMRSTTVATSSDPLATGGAVATGTAGPFGPMMDTAMEELFVPHTEGTKYLERESKSLGEMYLNLLLRFTKYHVSFSVLFSLNVPLTTLGLPRKKPPSPRLQTCMVGL